MLQKYRKSVAFLCIVVMLAPLLFHTNRPLAANAAEDDNVHSGVYSLEFKTVEAEWNDAAYAAIAGLERETDYQIKFWIKGTGKAQVGAGTAVSGSANRVENNNGSIGGTGGGGEDADGTAIGSGHKNAIATAAWVQHTVNFNSGSRTDWVIYMKDRGWANNSGSLFLDDLTVTKTGGDGTNLFAQGGFENGTLDSFSIPSSFGTKFKIYYGEPTVPVLPPSAAEVTFTGAAVVGRMLTASYTYQDPQGLKEQGTAFRWLKSPDNITYKVISGEKSRTLTVKKELEGQFLKVEVTVKNAGGVKGTAVTGAGPLNQVIHPGDVYPDTGVTYKDALHVLQYTAGHIILNARELSAADINQDGRVDETDVRLIQQTALAGEEEDTGAGERKPFRIGLFAGNSLTSVAEIEDWLGRGDFFINHYTGYKDWEDYDGSIGWAINTLWSKTDKEIQWNIPLLPKTGATLAEAGAGDYYAHYKNQAEKILDFLPDQSDIYVRIAWEFNGTWYPWTVIAKEGEDQGTRTRDFINAYRNCVEAFREVSDEKFGEDRFAFEWNVNIGKNFPLETAYPGDDYVDIIGMDAYDEQKWSGLSDPDLRFQYTVTRQYGLNWLRDFAAAHNKPVAISEWGVGGDESGDSPEYVENMYNWFNASNVIFQLYWDSNSAYEGKLRPPTNYPNASAKYKELFGSYTGPSAVNTPGNVLVAVTSPGGVRENNASIGLPSTPAIIRGIALDPDGSEYIGQVSVTLQNASGQYLNQAIGAFQNTPVYNPAVYDRTSGYWTLSLEGTNLAGGSGVYTVRAYANDGADSVAGICKFSR